MSVVFRVRFEEGLTFRLNISTLYFACRTSSSTIVRPMPPVPPATATVNILKVCWDVQVEGECGSYAIKIVSHSPNAHFIICLKPDQT